MGNSARNQPASTGRNLGLAGLGLAAWATACLDPRPSDEETPGRCSACHGSGVPTADPVLAAAPPLDLSGRTDPSSPGVGAHQIHLSAGTDHDAIRCDECHLVPGDLFSPGHVDSPGPAEFVPGALASRGGLSPTYDPALGMCAATYCHGASDAVWTQPRSTDEACGTCHGLPPPSPHPSDGTCGRCHDPVMGTGGEWRAPERHVDGQLDVSDGCGACHGSDGSPAPPPALSGSTDVSDVGVGAHGVHLSGTESSRAVECTACHVVPAEVGSAGHLDGAEHAEVSFSGVATADGRDPSWDRDLGLCSGSWCHGPSSPGSSISPEWTSASASISCQGCHGLPPPSPHPQSDACATCHSSVVASTPDGLVIIAPELHVDGTVEVFP